MDLKDLTQPPYTKEIVYMIPTMRPGTSVTVVHLSREANLFNLLPFDPVDFRHVAREQRSDHLMP